MEGSGLPLKAEADRSLWVWGYVFVEAHFGVKVRETVGKPAMFGVPLV